MSVFQTIIVRPVEIVRGARDIGKVICVGEGKVKDLEKAGAPIVRDFNGVPRADKAELWEWFKNNRNVVGWQKGASDC